MPDVRLSRRAQGDFRQIINHLNGVAGPATATKYGRAIRTSINRLADFPRVGSPRPSLGPAVRSLNVDPYLIFYELGSEDDTVFVLRILHGRRNITVELLKAR